jgi:choline-phosphate cytidylyltransferase
METNQPKTGKHCITYGTFDLFHEGHRRLLQRARALGSHLTVAVTSDTFDLARGKLNVRRSLAERLQAVLASGLADKVIVEEYEGQKIQDIIKFEIDVFVLGSDWTGHFDYLRKYCEVVYLDRTPGISSTIQRGLVRLGVVGCGRIARRFVVESRFVSGVVIEAVYSRSLEPAGLFAKEANIPKVCDSFDALLESVQAVYIASPHGTHFGYAKAALEAGRQVLCEKPLMLLEEEATKLHSLATEKGLVLIEAIKTAFMPGFQRMIALAQNGAIGQVCSVTATCTMIRAVKDRQYDLSQDGGSLTELASYPFLAVAKIFGTDEKPHLTSESINHAQTGVDILSRISMHLKNAMVSCTVEIGVKSEGDLVVAGTKGYLYVPAPWWLTSSFELRFEDPAARQTFTVPMKGDGLRYELAEFIKLINDEGHHDSCNLSARESIFIAGCVEMARKGNVSVGVVSVEDE